MRERWGMGVVGLALVVGACASTTVMIDGKAVPRIDRVLTGQAYSLRHLRAHPRPGGPSSGTTGDGGSIGGTICGMQIDYDVEHQQDHVQLIGFIDGNRTSQLRIADDDNGRLITGALHNRGVELRIADDRIEGHVGRRVFAVEREGDHFIGFMRSPGIISRDRLGDGATPIRINGYDTFRALSPAEQAAILPNLLTCWTSASEARIATTLVVGFGGPATALPAETSSLYSHDH